MVLLPSARLVYLGMALLRWGSRAGIADMLLAGCLAAALALISCTGTPKGNVTKPAAASSSGLQLPPERGRFSYQIGGPYSAPSGTQIIDRDRTAPSVKGVYSICYVNAFQAQTGDVNWWEQHHPQLLLRQSS